MVSFTFWFIAPYCVLILIMWRAKNNNLNYYFNRILAFIEERNELLYTVDEKIQNRKDVSDIVSAAGKGIVIGSILTGGGLGLIGGTISFGSKSISKLLNNLDKRKIEKLQYKIEKDKESMILADKRFKRGSIIYGLVFMGLYFIFLP